MKLLLDTHVLLCTAGEPNRLSHKTHALLGDPGNELLTADPVIARYPGPIRRV